MLKLRLLRGGSNWTTWRNRSVCQSAAASRGTGVTQAEAKQRSNSKEDKSEPEPPTKQNPPTSQSQKLAHTEVGLSSKPNKNQTRQLSTNPTQTQTQPEPDPTPDILCNPLNKSPWPETDNEDQKAQNKAQHEDNVDYFKDHKASPLSEIEIADTRKPITQATDTDNKNTDVLLFSEEQRDTAEQSLLRAREIWNWNRIRGDPFSPQGRVLRELRGEDW